MGQIKGQTSSNTIQTKDVTVTEQGTNVGLDVNIVSGGSVDSGGATAVKQDAQTLELQSINQKLQAPLISEDWDDFEVTSKNAAGCPTQVVYRLGAAVVATLDITYDVDGDLQRLQRS